MVQGGEGEGELVVVVEKGKGMGLRFLLHPPKFSKVQLVGSISEQRL